jgi:hypothetical protein
LEKEKEKEGEKTPFTKIPRGKKRRGKKNRDYKDSGAPEPFPRRRKGPDLGEPWQTL